MKITANNSTGGITDEDHSDKRNEEAWRHV